MKRRNVGFFILLFSHDTNDFIFYFGTVVFFASYPTNLGFIVWKSYGKQKKEGDMFLRQCHALGKKSFFLCIFWTGGHILNVIRIDFSKRISVVFSVICTNNFIPFWDSRI